jgi:hypothetical protein
LKYLKDKWIISIIAAVVTIIIIASACRQTPAFTPFASDQPSTLSPVMESPSPVSPTIPITAVSSPSFSPVINSKNQMLENVPYTKTSDGALVLKQDSLLLVSGVPAAGKVTHLMYIINVPVSLNKPIIKIRLQFERYDPSVYYPLGKSQHYKDEALAVLGWADPQSGLYFQLSHALADQPDTVVEKKEFVFSGGPQLELKPGEGTGSTPVLADRPSAAGEENESIMAGKMQWEVVPMGEYSQIQLFSNICFPQEGEWLIYGTAQYAGKSSDDYFCLTVKRDSGTLDWPREPDIFENIPKANPVGIYAKLSHAPLVNENMPLDITIRSIVDFDRAEAAVFCHDLNGKESVEVPLKKILVEGRSDWQGSLTKGETVQISPIIKFASEGRWRVSIATRASPEEKFVPKMEFVINVGAAVSRFAWTTSYDAINDAYKNVKVPANSETWDNIPRVGVEAPSQVGPDSDFTANITASNMTSFCNAEYYVVFDPEVLRLDDVTKGKIGSRTMPAQNWEVSRGLWCIVQMLSLNADVKGEGILAVLHFHAIGQPGQTSIISFTQGDVGNSYAKPVETQWTGSSISLQVPADGAGPSLSGSPSSPYFPTAIDFATATNTDVDWGYTTALADGYLVLEKGYLRVINEQMKLNDIIIWPHGYSLRLKDGQVEISDSEGRLRARTWEKIRIGGSGKNSRDMAEMYVGQSLPADAVGPYYITPSVEAFSYFPVQLKEYSGRIETPSSITGEIILDNGYLRLKREIGDSELVIWPYGYSLGLAYGTFWVLDENNQPTINCINMSKILYGKEVDLANAQKYAGPTLPDNASGPFWLVSSIEKPSPN